MARHDIEVEKKFYLRSEELVPVLVECLGLSNPVSTTEYDAYFTDLDGRYVKDRTCLRLRHSPTKDNATIDFKGRSSHGGNLFAKVESNLPLGTNAIPGLFKLFSNLGYYKYSSVNKHRTSYQRQAGDMLIVLTIDHVEGIGAFIEIEITCPEHTATLDDVRQAYEREVTAKIANIPLEEASLPYRDIVARQVRDAYLKSARQLVVDIDHMFLPCGGLGREDKTRFEAFATASAQAFKGESLPALQDSPNGFVSLDYEAQALGELGQAFQLTLVSQHPQIVSQYLALNEVAAANMKIVTPRELAAVQPDSNILALVSSAATDSLLPTGVRRIYKRIIPGVPLGVNGLEVDGFTELALMYRFAEPL